MLDEIESDTESDIENLLEDFDTEYISEEPIPDNKKESHGAWTPAATSHIENESLNVEEPLSKNPKRKITALKWKQTSKFIKAKKCTLKTNVLLEVENANPLQILQSTIELNELVKFICDQSNLHAAQNGREFATTSEKIRAFLGINYILSIYKLPNLKCYWSIDSYLSNDGVRNTMTNILMKILQNLHFNNNETADKSDKAYKTCNVINYPNEAFQNVMSNTKRQSIDEHTTKFKARISCKQYMKNMTIKWGFKGWCWSCSKTGYLYELDLYLGKKEKAELRLGEAVVLDLLKKLENTNCMLYFDNVFNFPTLVDKRFDKGIYCLGTVWSDRKNIAVMKKDKDMKRSDIDFQYAKNVIAVK